MARRVAVSEHQWSSIEAVSEVIGAAAISGASLQIVHINSSCIADAPECLSMIAGARARGLDVTTEAYPYIAGFTTINSALFNPGWREKLGVGYDALQLPDSGERLTKERFDLDALRKMSLMPAERLAKSTPAAHRKGQLQEGADADIVAFNPQSVADRSTCQSPREPSVGMQYVIVNGSVLIDAGQFVPGSFPGRAIAPDPVKHWPIHHP
jgi:Amidohydrolase family